MKCIPKVRPKNLLLRCIFYIIVCEIKCNNYIQSTIYSPYNQSKYSLQARRYSRVFMFVTID